MPADTTSIDALFIADLHLHTSAAGTLALAQHFLENVAPHSHRLFILGDFVEYWIGDDADDGSLESIFSAIRSLADHQTNVTLMHGNRDFLMGQALADKLNATLLTEDEHLLHIGSQRLLLMHGDSLCTDDTDYQLMRKQLRNANWQAEFLAKPVTEREAIAQSLREQSIAATAQKNQTQRTQANADSSASIMDVNNEAVIKAMEQAGVETLVHGHTHRPAEHNVQLSNTTQSGKRWVVGDWHPDKAIYGMLQNDKLTLETHQIP